MLGPDGRAPDLSAVFVVTPAYNEEQTIRDVLGSFRRHAFPHHLVVDDGSSDATAALARLEGAIVVRHVINRGLGAALGTGLAAAVARGAQVIVTVDADGQHTPEDAFRVIVPVLRGDADFVVGTRLLDSHGMPGHRRLANTVANLLTVVLFGARSTDSQSGLRAFSRRAAERIEIRTDGMEVSSEIIGESRRQGLRCLEVPITSIYTDYSLSKGQSFWTGLRTLRKLLLLKLEGRDR